MLMGELSSLDELEPGSAFRGRVLDGVARRETAPERAPLAARVRAWLAPSGHPEPARLQDFVDGALGGRAASALRRHLTDCAHCRAEAQRWAALVGELAALQPLAPSPGFAQAVMRHVRIAPAPGTAHALGRRLLGRARALAGPRRRRAWAAAAGVACTPVATAGMIAYVVFSHPLVTVGGLASFAWLKGSTLVTTAAGGLGTGLIGSASTFRAWSTVQSLSPTAAGAGLLGVCALTLASAWVVYRNVIAPEAQVARVQR
jgi:hypothetical protein